MTTQSELQRLNAEIRRTAQRINKRIKARDILEDEYGFYGATAERLAAIEERLPNNMFRIQQPRVSERKFTTIKSARKRLRDLRDMDVYTQRLTRKGEVRLLDDIYRNYRHSGGRSSKSAFLSYLKIKPMFDPEYQDSEPILEFLDRVDNTPDDVLEQLPIDFSDPMNVTKFINEHSFPNIEFEKLLDDYYNELRGFNAEGDEADE